MSTNNNNNIFTRVNPSTEAVINGYPGQLKNWQLKEKITITDQLSEKCKNYVQTMYNVDGGHEWFKDSFSELISVLTHLSVMWKV